MKFVRDPEDTSKAYIGYVLDVKVAILDQAKIPARYKTTRKETSASGEWEIEPLSVVAYSAHVSFSLMDSDGFSLSEIDGPTFTLLSGQHNSFQEMSESAVVADIARRTIRIVPKLSVDKCESCE